MFVVLGEALMDLVINDKGTTLNAHYGGGPFNTSLALARLGESVHFHFPLSNDYYGKKFLAFFKKNSIFYSCPYVSDYPTALALTNINSEGNAEYRFYRNNTAERDLRENLLISNLPEDTRVIHTGTLAISDNKDCSIVKNILLSLKNKKTLVSLDPNIRFNIFSDKNSYRKNVKSVMNIADIIKLSNEDMEFLYPDLDINEAIEKVKNDYPNCSLLVVTGGAKYIIAISKKHKIEIKPHMNNVAGDTIGAGDCFVAGLLHQCNRQNLLQKEVLDNINKDDLMNVVRVADIVAGENCQRKGCNPPYIREIQELL